MATPVLRVIAFLTRLDTTAFVFAAVFFPILLGMGDAALAARAAIPLVPICMCGFVLNNIHDAEKDRENHPERPLPREEVSQRLSAVLFLLLLATALVSLRFLIAADKVFPYVLLLIALIAYNHVVAYLTAFKNVVVALAGVLPIAIVSAELRGRVSAPGLMIATFLFLMSFEMVSDIRDLRGDGQTLVKRLGQKWAPRVALVCKLCSDGVLLSVSHSALQSGLSLAFVATDLVLGWLWFSGSDQRWVTRSFRVEAMLSVMYLIS